MTRIATHPTTVENVRRVIAAFMAALAVYATVGTATTLDAYAAAEVTDVVAVEEVD